MRRIHGNGRSGGIRIVTAGAVLGLAIALAPATQAQTPDGETPAEESVCDPLMAEGVTKGLYGLCIAYCEGQDLDAFDKSDAQGDSVPGDKLLEIYDRRRAASDPDMPCLASECPCFNTALCAAEGGFRCEVAGARNIADFFPQTQCDIRDKCSNTPNISGDFCTQSSPRIFTTVVAGVNEGEIGWCHAHIWDDGVLYNLFPPEWGLDADIARKCIDEMNAFDGNDEGDGTVDPCGL